MDYQDIEKRRLVKADRLRIADASLQFKAITAASPLTVDGEGDPPDHPLSGRTDWEYAP